jgi:hypothetical protein
VGVPDIRRATAPPSPDTVATLDDLCARLRDLRAWAGSPSFSRVVDDIAVLRAARGLPLGERRPGRVTVYECFRPGRRRIDVELLVDIVAALGVAEPGQARWRHAHRVASSAGTGAGAPGPDSQARAVAAVVGAVTTGGKRVVNLVGPVGIGKTTILNALPLTATRVDVEAGVPAGQELPDLVLVDDIDAPDAVAVLVALLDGHPRTRAVVASRRPLPGWPDLPAALLPDIAVVPAPPWTDADLDALADRAGIADPGLRRQIVDLAGGIPLLADRLCRAVFRGASARVPGALADLAATEVIARLGRERPAAATADALGALASSGQADQDLLGRDLTEFGRVSLVHAAADGIAVSEPYRTLFDHVYQWRRPACHRGTVSRAQVHNRRLIAVSSLDERVRRTEHGLWLSGDTTVRDTLFPPSGEGIAVRGSTVHDGEDVMRLLHRWAHRGGLDVRRSERVLSPFVADRPDGFRVARDHYGEILGAIMAIPLSDHVHNLVEPLLERFTPDVATDGVFVGMAMSRDRHSQAALLRDVLVRGVISGQVVVATQWPAYQRLIDRLDFTELGLTQDDVFRCGRRVQVSTLRLNKADLASWLSRVRPGKVHQAEMSGRAVGTAVRM